MYLAPQEPTDRMGGGGGVAAEEEKWPLMGVCVWVCVTAIFYTSNFKEKYLQDTRKNESTGEYGNVTRPIH